MKGTFQVAIKGGSFQSGKTKLEKPGHEVLTLEYPDVILVQHRFYCQVCEKTPHKVFMAKTGLWERSELDGFICHECFQIRLGRKFTVDDLTNAPCNDWLKWQITLDEREKELV